MGREAFFYAIFPELLHNFTIFGKIKWFQKTFFVLSPKTAPPPKRKITYIKMEGGKLFPFSNFFNHLEPQEELLLGIVLLEIRPPDDLVLLLKNGNSFCPSSFCETYE